GDENLDRAATEQLTFTNFSDAPVEVRSLAIAGSPEVRLVEGALVPETILPGRSMTVRLTYAPEVARQLDATLVVEVEGVESSTREVPIEGSAEGPRFLVSPDFLSFGAVTEARTRRSLLLSNAGSSSVELGSVELRGDAGFQLEGVPPLPTEIESGGTLLLTVALDADRDGTFSATVAISTDDATSPFVEVPARGFRGARLCTLEASPSSTNFGVLEPGWSRTSTVILRNMGNSPCEIRGMAFREPSDPFFWLVRDGSMTLALDPGQELPVAIAFEPTSERTAKATLLIETNDPIEPIRTVGVLGSSLGYGNVFVQPSSVDLGVIRPSCNVSNQTISLINAGRVAVDVRRIEVSSPISDLAIQGPGSGTLLGGEVYAWNLRWAPVVEDTVSTDIVITFDDLSFPLRVPIFGVAANDARRIESFAQREVTAVDVLFVIDDSGSMGDDQAALASNASMFIEQADLRETSYRIGITTTSEWPEQGALVGPVIDGDVLSRDEVIDRFRQQAVVGTGGSAVEEGAASAIAALRRAEQGRGFNRALVRPRAWLAIIIVTDEDDSSPLSMVAYSRDLQARASEGLLLAVVSGGANGCTASDPRRRVAFAAPRYASLVQLSGGVAYSICSDWGNNLRDLGRTAFAAFDQFVLQSPPETTLPIEVSVNGVPADPSTYRFEENVLSFDAPPAADSTITVSYVPRCER
ncbi:MAG: choice-of-anchor D domain-containing protein, partial [Myxococcales bacterium]|nr:choice-of-anchor D domain-containing protein [Myxococcales bacterium]